MALFKKKPKKGEAPAAANDAERELEEGAEGAEGASAEEGKKKPSKKLVLIAGAAALVVLGGGGAGAWMMLKPKPAAEAGKEGEQKQAKAKKKKKEEKKDGKAAPGAGGAIIADGPEGVVFYTLPELVVNMQTGDGRPTYLKLKLTLELPDHETVEVLEPNRPRLQDMFQTFLRELRPEDLSGSQGSYQLRMEVQRRINLVIAPAKVNAVLIEEMLIN